MQREIIYPISIDYLNHWTLNDALREFLQNAIDANRNEMAIDYSNNKLLISNKGIITEDTLLLGNTTKSEDSNSIGQYGEGYKMGALVCTRLNKPVSIVSGDFIFTFSKTLLNTIEVLKCDISEGQKDWEFTTVKIDNISKEEFDSFNNTHLIDKTYASLSSNFGEVLIEEGIGNIYVNGIYVCKNTSFRYGYNLLAKHLPLNRDRNVVSDFDLSWITSKIWTEIGNDNFDLFIELLENGNNDIKFIENSGAYSNIKLLANKVFEYHKNKQRNLPVSSQSEVTKYSSYSSTPSYYYSSSNYSSLYRRADNYKEPKKQTSVFRKNMKPSDAILIFIHRNMANLNTDTINDINTIANLSNNWRVKQSNNENN